MRARTSFNLWIALLCAGAAALSGLSWLHFSRQAEKIPSHLASELLGIARLKVGQVAKWRGDRLADGVWIRSDDTLIVPLQSFLARPSSRDLMREAERHLRHRIRPDDFQGVQVSSADGQVLFSLPEGDSSLDEHILPALLESLQHGKSTLTDIFLDSRGNPAIKLIVPALPGDKSGPAPGALILSIDPRRGLFPLVELWPTDSVSGESFLVRRDGEDVLYLNDLRHRPDSAAKLRLPNSDQRLASAQAVSGGSGLISAVDYRGAAVVAALLPIPESDWHLVAKLDRDEIQCPLDALRVKTSVFTLITVLLFAAAAALFWRRQRALRREAETERLTLLKGVIGTAADAIAALDRDLRFTLFNEAYLSAYRRFYGAEPAVGAAYGKGANANLDALKISRAAWERALDGEAFRTERVFPSPEGGRAFFEISYSPIADCRGKTVGAASIVHEITPHRNLEAALGESEKRFRDLLENVELLAVMLDQNGRVTFCNAFLLNTLGWEAGDLIGESWFDRALPQEAASELRPLYQRLLADSTTLAHHENEVLTKDGGRRLIRWSNTILHDSAGNPIGAASIGEDVTERHHLQRQLVQAQRMEAVGQLAGGVAHDFNNLLTVIEGYLHFIADAPEASPAVKGHAEKAALASRRAAALTSQLLSFSRKQLMRPTAVDLNAMIRELEEVLRPLLGGQIDLQILPFEGLWTVNVDPSHFEQLIINLATNARDAMPEGGTLVLETANAAFEQPAAGARVNLPPGEYVLLAVSDTGCGMDQQTAAKIFEPFFTTKEKGRGTGLGLAAVYGIVKQSGGHLSVYTEPGKGTAFKIYLPRMPGPAAAAPSPAAPSPPARGSETILIIEDEPLVRKMACASLRGYGYTVLEAGDGEEAMAAARESAGSIHLLLCDVVIPGRPIQEVVKMLRAARPELKVVYMSGYTENAIVHGGVVEPGVPFLSKPFTPTDLRRKVREILDA